MSTTKRALICGISGQDGAYLARMLLEKGYEVCGSSRDAQMQGFGNLAALGIAGRVRLVSMALTDFRSVVNILQSFEPSEIYNLAGQSSVGLSFEQPVETMESISIATLNLLEAIRIFGKSIRLYNAGSAECYGENSGSPADEATAFRPRSPYAVAKAAAFWQVANYREAYGIYAASGILFNHESPLRPERFVTRKIVAAACRIARGSDEVLSLGNLAIQRDWGWAPEYVEAMWLLLQQETPEDFVVATGECSSLEQFTATVFESLGLDWRVHVRTDPALFRPTDLNVSRANPAKAREKLNWFARYRMRDVARMMVEAEMHAQPKGGTATDAANSPTRNLER